MRFAVGILLVVAACSSSYGADEPAPLPDRDRDAGTNDDGGGGSNDAGDAGVDAPVLPDSGTDSGTPCLGDLECARLVFVSSSTGDGAQAGFSGADQECQELADASALTKGRAFKAWLADSNMQPAGRLPHGNKPYRRVDGMPVASDWTSLTSGTLLNAINRDETGAFVDDFVWTGSRPDGTAVGQNCQSWASGSSGTNGKVGKSNATTRDWTENTDHACDQPHRIYCFEN